MEDEYITNINTDDVGDIEILEKLKKAEAELSKVKSELDEKSKLYLDQKHNLEELDSENKNLKSENKDLQNLLKIYEDLKEKPNESAPKEKEKMKELEIKIMNLEEKIKEYDEKIKEYDEKIIIKENELEVVKKDLTEQKEIGEHALVMLTEKEDELKELKEKYEKEGLGLQKKNSESELTPDEVKELREMFISQQDEYEAYKKNTAEKIRNYSDEMNKLYTEEKELKEKISKLESDLSFKNDKIETLENEKKISEEKLLEKKQSEDIKLKDFYSEIRNLETQ